MDVLLSEQSRGEQPWALQLLEVNFCPDFTSQLRFSPQFVDEVFLTLFTQEPVPRSMVPLWQAKEAVQLDAID